MDMIAGFLAAVTVGDVILATVLASLAHASAADLLPDRVAGPGGWLIDTSKRD